MKYEIYYETGGHCGPFATLAGAIEDGKRKLLGNINEKVIEIRETTSNIRGGYSEHTPNSYYLRKNKEKKINLEQFLSHRYLECDEWSEIQNNDEPETIKENSNYEVFKQITSNLSVLNNGKIQIGCGVFDRAYVAKEIRELQEALEVANSLVNK